jgi:hypothetical protein
MNTAAMTQRSSGMARGAAGFLTVAALTGGGLLLAGCDGGPNTDPFPTEPQQRGVEGTLFGDEGLSLGSLNEAVTGGEQAEGGSLPVNKFLWQASLDTLSFLPLASTDPFTGVIATDWGIAPQSPGERFKVTAYMLSPALAASSLKIAVYREIRSPEGVWVPAAVDPDTPRKLEDAILTRARQIRIAEIEGEATG